MRTLATVLVVLLAAGAGGDALQREKAAYYADAQKLAAEYQEKCAKLRAKYAARANEGIKTATKTGNLDDALQWKSWHASLSEVGMDNVARSAKISVSREREDGMRHRMIDGSIEHSTKDGYWYAEQRSPETWAAFALREPRMVERVRMLTPKGVVLRDGFEPIDYEIEAWLGEHRIGAIVVRDGNHASETTAFGGACVWIEVPIKSIWCDQIRFLCHRTSGSNLAPIVYEFEILAKR